MRVQLESAGMIWEDPDEEFLGMADLSPFYLALNVRPIWRIDEEPIHLLELLQMKKGVKVDGVISTGLGERGEFLPPPASSRKIRTKKDEGSSAGESAHGTVPPNKPEIPIDSEKVSQE